MARSSNGPVFAGFRFTPEVIAVPVRWYLRYGLSYATLKSSSPSAVSPSTAKCNGHCRVHRSSPARPARGR
jgi:hypothetical protein